MGAMMTAAHMTGDGSRRRAQFELERALRSRILESAPHERARIVAQAYGELFERFPDHNVFLATPADRARYGRHCAGMIRPLAAARARILEIGCGRGDVLVELARSGFTCVGLEPSTHMHELCNRDGNVAIHRGTAERLDFPDDSFDVVFSQQVLEHLHPDDVPRHFAEAFRVLRPGGRLAVETPNRRTGPQDISRGFVRVAEGLHLKEWSFEELSGQFAAAGFVRVRGLLAPPFLARRSTILHVTTRVPVLVKKLQDLVVAGVPRLAPRTLVAKLLGVDDVFLFALKPRAGASQTTRG
jgi:SAM-dependent methyltransferase